MTNQKQEINMEQIKKNRLDWPRFRSPKILQDGLRKLGCKNFQKRGGEAEEYKFLFAGSITILETKMSQKQKEEYKQQLGYKPDLKKNKPNLGISEALFNF